MRQHPGVDIDRHDMTGDFRHLQGEPSVAAAQVDDVRAARKADLSQYACGIRPERLPPRGVRHLCALKKSGQVAAHYPSSCNCRLFDTTTEPGRSPRADSAM